MILSRSIQFYLLGGSLELINLDMNKKENLIRFENIKDVLNFLKREGDYSLLAELCGLVGLDEHKNIVYKQMQNRSKNPEAYFLIDPFDYLSFIKDEQKL